MEANSFKQVGVWVDHSKSHFIGHHNGNAILIETMDAPYEKIEKDERERTRFGSQGKYSSNNENKKHNIAQNELNEYFKTLEGKLTKFEDILLFGPGKVKERLNNRLFENKSFTGKWISVQNSDKMTDNQLLAFVRDFFKS